MAHVRVYVESASLARSLRAKRLLTSSLAHEPTSKHQQDRDDPDALEGNTKQARKAARFDFDKLLPLSLTLEEATLARELELIDLRRVSESVFVARERPSDANQVEDEMHTQTTTNANKDSNLQPGDDLQSIAGPTIRPDVNNENDVWKQVKSSAKYMIFRHLWSNGMCLVDGLKFGVDYLAYAKDPLKHHAEFMVLICSCDDNPSVIDIVATAAVASKANKSLLVASLINDQVTFTKMERLPVVPKESRKGARGRFSRGKTDEDIIDEVPAI